jgi:DnaJ-class molecular chaperone
MDPIYTRYQLCICTNSRCHPFLFENLKNNDKSFIMKDLYSILDISRDSNDKMIGKSYRKLAFMYHPDRNKDNSDSSEKFRDISEAYSILTDPKKRTIYDKFGYEAVSETQEIVDPIELFQSLFNVDFTGEFQSDIFFFSDLSSTPFDASDKQVYEIDCTLDELYKGTKKEFTLNRRTKYSETSRNYVINIKPGSHHKDNIIIKEGGDYIEGRGHTDLGICIKQLPHETYTRKGNDLYIETEITLKDSLCGTNLTIEYFGDFLTVQINEIVKPNSLYQVFGKGMPIKSNLSLTDGNQGDLHGNLILDLTIQFPEVLNSTSREYLSQVLGNDLAEGVDVPNDTIVTSAYFLEKKEDVLKTLMNEDEEEGLGCLQQ